MSEIWPGNKVLNHEGVLYALNPVKAFEVGKWYVYTETEKPSGWVGRWPPSMTELFDGEPRRCSRVCGEKKYIAAFDGVNDGWSWDFSDILENWREVVGHPKAKTADEAKEPDGWQLGAWYRDGSDGAVFQIVEISPRGKGYQDRFPNDGEHYSYQLDPSRFQLLHSPTPIGEQPEGLDVVSEPKGQSHCMTIIDDVAPAYNGDGFDYLFYSAMLARYYMEIAAGKTEILSSQSSIGDRARSMLRDL